MTIVSPRNFFVYTPLLPGAATGTVELRSITEAVRSLVAGAPPRFLVIIFYSSSGLEEPGSGPRSWCHSAALYHRGCAQPRRWCVRKPWRPVRARGQECPVYTSRSILT